MTRAMKNTGLFAITCLLALPAGAPLWADADGLPHLDPTNGGAGTTYTFVMPQVSRTMNPLNGSNQGVYRGTFRLFQDAGEDDFDVVDMDVDVNGDGVADRTLRCSGRNGFTRFAMRCSEDDGGNDVDLLITGRAVRLLNGTIMLRKAVGQGFTETHLLLVAFGAFSD